MFANLVLVTPIAFSQENSNQTDESVQENIEQTTENEQNNSTRSQGQAMPLDQKINELYSNIVTYVAGPIAILFLVYAGYLYITSAGNPEQVGMAKDMIVSTIIAIVILLLAGLILRTIGQTPVGVPENSNQNQGQVEEQEESGEGQVENDQEESLDNGENENVQNSNLDAEQEYQRRVREEELDMGNDFED